MSFAKIEGVRTQSVFNIVQNNIGMTIFAPGGIPRPSGSWRKQRLRIRIFPSKAAAQHCVRSYWRHGMAFEADLKALEIDGRKEFAAKLREQREVAGISAANRFWLDETIKAKEQVGGRLEKRRAAPFSCLCSSRLRSLRIGNKHFAGLSDHCRREIPHSPASNFSPGTTLSATTRVSGCRTENELSMMFQLDELDQNVALHFDRCLFARLVARDLRFHRRAMARNAQGFYQNGVRSLPPSEVGRVFSISNSGTSSALQISQFFPALLVVRRVHH